MDVPTCVHIKPVLPRIWLLGLGPHALRMYLQLPVSDLIPQPQPPPSWCRHLLKQGGGSSGNSGGHCLAAMVA